MSFAQSVGSTYERVVTGRLLVQLTIPQQIAKFGGQMQIRFAFRTGAFFGTPTVTFFAKYIEVMAGRDIGLNFKDFTIGSPEYSSIGAAPLPPSDFIPID
jgi:hypothetical protein